MKKIVLTLSAIGLFGILEVTAQEQKSVETTSPAPVQVTVKPVKSLTTAKAAAEPKTAKVKKMDAHAQENHPLVTPVRTEERKQEAVKKEEEK